MMNICIHVEHDEHLHVEDDEPMYTC